MILLENNNRLYSTRGKGDNKVKKTKLRLSIKWKVNPLELSDLNLIKTI
jgi:hypothetical protein